MKQQFSKILFFLCLLLVLIGCYKDDASITKTIIRDYPEVIVEEARVGGSLVHADGSIPNDGRIWFSNENSQSSYPYFYFHANNINQHFEILHVENEIGLHLTYPLTTTANDITIHSLIIPNQFETLSIESNSLIIRELNNSLLSFDAIAFEKDGIAQQSPTIYYSLLENHTLPGDLQGLSEEQEAIIIDYDDVFYLGWTDQTISGSYNKFNLANETQQLFFLNSETGQWNEVQIKQNLKSGFYSIGKKILSKPISITINDLNELDGNSLYTIINGKQYNANRISQSGKTTRFVPLEDDFTMVLRNRNILLEEYEINAEQEETFTLLSEEMAFEVSNIHIRSKDCEDLDLEHSMIRFEADGNHVIFASTSSIFRIPRPSSSEINSQLISGTSNVISQSISLPVSNEIEMGRQYLCPSFGDEYLYLITDGHKRVYPDIDITFLADEILISSNESDFEFTLKIRQLFVGEVEDTKTNIYLDAPSISGGYRLNCLNSAEGCGFDEIKLTHFNTEIGRFIKGNFEGIFWIQSYGESNVGNRPMKGEFQIKVQ